MNLYKPYITLLNLTLLSSYNVVNCTAKNDSSNNERNSTTNNTSITSRTPKFLSIVFAIKLQRELQSYFTHPNKMYKINFYGYTIGFDNNAMSPAFNIVQIDIYTCHHHFPVLVCMQNNYEHYFYSLDPQTNKWTNHKIKYDSTFKEHTDKNGIYYYTPSRDTNATVFTYENEELAKQLCKKDNCNKLDITKTGDIQVYLKKIEPNSSNQQPKETLYLISNSKSGNNPTQQPNVQDVTENNTTQQPNVQDVTENDAVVNQKLVTLKFVSKNTDTNNTVTIKHGYNLHQSQKFVLSHTNIIEMIKFYNYTMVFDEKTKLPTINVERIIIYTCKHYNPRLLFIYGNEKYYAYSPNSKKNKWNNHKLKYDTRFEKFTDEDGLTFYTPSSKNSSKDKFEDKELIKIHCKEGKCENVNTKGHKDLKIYLK